MLEDRVFVAIDVENLWYAAREAFGNNFRVNFNELRKLLAAVNPPPFHIEAIAYVVISPDHDNTKFLGMLDRLDYKVKKRFMRYNKAKDHAIKSDWDVGITVDTMVRSECDDSTPRIDRFVLVSGDGDYFYLCEELKRRGVEVFVCTFGNVCAKSLKNVADKIIMLSEQHVFDIKNGNGGND